ncbi:biopolymer transporter ExbD [Lacimonas salitolerans]|uniref:Biopolymer transporter ExbD n=1 Tax=Lacimonas salitolerans TaxID=1323750 RepID=A0ABW4EB30_9RHOB
MARALRKRRRRLSMTSLIDVIFLLLLFFMLSSTFTRFAEVDLAAAGSGAGQGDARPVFLSLGPDSLQVNGTAATLETLVETITADQPDAAVIVALRGAVTAQRLTDLLVTLRAQSGLRITVLGAT